MQSILHGQQHGNTLILLQIHLLVVLFRRNSMRKVSLVISDN
jgi:hypothetical protein